MKTTSYKICKKLKEAGFDAEGDFGYHKSGQFPLQKLLVSDTLSHIKAYDLETLINALPDFITREYKSKNDSSVNKFKERLIIEKNEIRYSCDDIENADDANRYYQEYGYMQDISVFKKFNDNSLADMAGRMWLLLKEKGIV